MNPQDMNLYIPSRSRFERSLTLEALHGNGIWPRDQIFLVVPTDQRKDYRALAKRHKVEILPCPEKGIANTRRFIGEHAGQKFAMFDDDLRFFHRPSAAPPKLFKIDTLDQGMFKMLRYVSNALNKYAHVAISAREGNNRLDWPFVENSRPLRVLCFQKEPFLSCAHGRVAIMEDFDVTLQLMRMGFPNLVISKYAQDQVQTQASGGCSDYRTLELHAKNVKRLAKLHAPFVALRFKENKGGGAFGRRQEATIYWKKAWESSQ